MRFTRAGLAVCLLVFTSPVRSRGAQQGQPAAAVQGTALLTQSLTALAGTTVVSDATLNGTANRIIGSDDENGSVVMKAMHSGQSLLTFASASGNRSELTTVSSTGSLVGSWTGTDGVSHPMSYQNLLTDSAWFFPALTLSKILASQTNTVVLSGPETKDDVPVTHVTVSQQFADASADAAVLMQHLSQMEVYLNASTLLPVALDFNTHPDNNVLLDIPVEIRFSEYSIVNGVQIPFHIQKYMNNVLVLDIQLQSATVNSGLNATAFSAQ